MVPRQPTNKRFMTGIPPIDTPPDTAPNAVPDEAAAAKPESTLGGMLSSSKTQLAIGVAATLGVMVFYKWREKQLAKKEPEEYARLKRIKASVLRDEVLNTRDENTAQTDAAGSTHAPSSLSESGAKQ
jgi:hypothetical protein